MMNLYNIFTVIGISFLLSGCGWIVNTFTFVGLNPTAKLQNIDRPNTSVKPVTDSITFDMKGNSLSKFNIVQLQGYIEKQSRPQNLSVIIFVQSPDYADAAINIRKYFYSKGTDKDRLYIKYKTMTQSDSASFRHKVTLKTVHYVANIGSCPDYSTVNGPSYSNFGCSSAKNFFIHVSEPRDKLMGRKLAPAPSAPKVKLLTDYYNGKIPNLKPKDMTVPNTVGKSGTGATAVTPPVNPTPTTPVNPTTPTSTTPKSDAKKTTTTPKTETDNTTD